MPEEEAESVPVGIVAPVVLQPILLEHSAL